MEFCVKTQSSLYLQEFNYIDTRLHSLFRRRKPRLGRIDVEGTVDFFCLRAARDISKPLADPATAYADDFRH